MAKKSRRVRKKGRQVRLSSVQMAQPGMGDTAGAPPDVAQKHFTSEGSDLREEYRYVATDLKRIGLIAVAVLVVLVVVALVLT